jgi:NAD(P)-dependent dehydrogenase (short-subunit alcohol dehydrogenase family)
VQIITIVTLITPGCKAFAQKVLALERKIHVLVNNAGATWGADFGVFPLAAWDKILDLNVKSVFFMSRCFMPALTREATSDDPARIINIGSVAGIERGNGGDVPLHLFGSAACKVATQLFTM